jgi:hypothetical protein
VLCESTTKDVVVFLLAIFECLVSTSERTLMAPLYVKRLIVIFSVMVVPSG